VRLSLHVAKIRGFSYTDSSRFPTRKLADFAVNKTRIFPKTFGIYFPINKRVYYVRKKQGFGEVRSPPKLQSQLCLGRLVERKGRRGTGDEDR
jgi:hypothetical protein